MYVYEGNAEDTLSTGLVGRIDHISCEFEEVENGLSQITTVFPMDDDGRWKSLVEGRLLKIPVPVRTTPEINMDNPDAPSRVTSVEKWYVKTAASKANRALYKKATGSKKGRKLLPLGSAVTVVKLGEKRHRCKTVRGTGWVNIDGIEYSVTETIADENRGIESASEPVKVVDQLFRIRSVEIQMKTVTVKAVHVFYDLKDNIASYSAATCSAGAALLGVADGCEVAHDFDFYTDSADTRSAIKFERVSPVEALLNPETGIAARWGLKLIRDDYDVYLLRSIDTDRGMVIEYAENMVDMTVARDSSELITRIMPMGKNKKGKPLFLPEKFIDSPKIGEFPTIRAALIDYSDTCTMENGLTQNQVYAEMRRLAALEYSENHVDESKTTVTVKYISLGDTEEFAQYKGLDRIYLYDTVTVKHPKAGINLSAEVTRIKWQVGNDGDGRVIEMDVSNVRAGSASRKIPSWQVPVIDGSKIDIETLPGAALIPKTITDEELGDGSVTTPAIAEGAVTETAIGSGAVNPTHLKDETVNHLNAESITALTAKFNEIVADSVTTDALYAAIAEIVTLRAKQITADTIDTDTLYAALAEISNLWAKTANISYANIVDAYVDRLFADAEIAGKVRAKNLIVDQAQIVDLIVNAFRIVTDDGKVYKVTVDENGALKSEFLYDQDEWFEDGKAPAGYNPVADSFTADEITTGTLYVTGEASFMQVFAKYLNVNEAFINNLTTNLIQSDIGGKLRLESGESIESVVSGIYTDMDEKLGYRMEIVSTSDILSEAIKTTTLTARVWHGKEDVTASLSASRFAWKRISADDTGDRAWNSAHIGMTSITLGVQDVAYSATYSCELTDE